MQPVTGQRFGRYLLGLQLGHGGMGVVYAATDTILDRRVALKLVAPHLAEDREFRARFSREATLLARLDSAHAVRIYDHGEQDGVLYIATQLVEGGDLAGLVASGSVTPAEAVDLVCQVLEGLADAHAAGVTHRDVKPANVLIRRTPTRAEALLCDFGIARAAGAQITQTGSVSGSLSWMAPERHDGDDAGAAGDVYSAGCLLWFALTGASPYAGTDVQIAMGHLQAPVPQLPGKDRFHRGVNAVLARAMAKSPRRRYPSAEAMLADLRPLAGSAPSAVAVTGASTVRRLGTRRTRWLVPVVACAAVLALVGTAFGARALLDGPPPDHRAGAATTTRSVTPTYPSDGRVGPDAPGEMKRTASRHRHSSGPDAIRSDHPRRAHPPAAASSAPAATAAAPSRAPTHAPAPARFRCWNGRTVTGRVSKCGMPTGLAGMRWLFPGARACAQAVGIPSTTADKERWTCHLTAPDGTSAGVGMTRFSSVAAGKSFYSGWFGRNGWTGWSSHGQDAGWQMTGTNKDGTLRASSYHYRSIPWAISPSGKTYADADWILGRMGPLRKPSELYGVRIR